MAAPVYPLPEGLSMSNLRRQQARIGLALGLLVASSSVSVVRPARADQPHSPHGKSGTAEAERAPVGGASDVAAPKEMTPKEAEAVKRFKRGIELFEEGNSEAAQIEFQRAYELNPSWKLLYNIAICYRAEKDYVAALEAFERYLEEGGANVPSDRRQAVEEAIGTLKPRIGRISVTANVPGARVAIDDIAKGTIPLSGPIPVNPGRRRVTVSMDGWIPKTDAVVIAPSESKTMTFTLNKSKSIVIRRSKGIKPYLPYIAWGTAGALAAGAGVTGFFALKASSAQEDRLQDPNTTGDDLANGRSTMRTLSIVSDALTVAAVASGGLALYWTLKPPGKDDPSEKDSVAQRPHKPKVNVGFGPASVGVAGTF